MKKILISLLIILNLFEFTIFAQTAETNITLPNDFLLYSENKAKVCEILKISEEELDEYCLEKSISYLAVDEDNSRQIKLLTFENEFSEATIDFDFFSQEELEENMGTIVGHKEKRPLHSVVTAGDQSFIKTEYFDTDENGSFSFIQYYTVEDSKNYCLVFLTNEGADTSYIDDVFNDFAKNEVFTKEHSTVSQSNNEMTVTIILIAAISVLAAAILFTVIKDIIKSKKSFREEIEETEEN